MKVAEVNELCAELELLDGLRGDGTAKSQQTRLGRALQTSRDRVFAGLRLVLVRDAGHKGKSYALVRQESTDRQAPLADKLEIPIVSGAVDPWGDEGNLEATGDLRGTCVGDVPQSQLPERA